MSTALQWAIAAGLGGILLEVIRSIFQRKKMGADAAKTNVATAMSLLDPLRAEIARLQAEVASARQELTIAKVELSEARREVRHLRDRVRASEKGMD